MDFQIGKNITKRIIDEIGGVSRKSCFALRVSETMTLVIFDPTEGRCDTIWTNADFSACVMLESLGHIHRDQEEVLCSDRDDYFDEEIHWECPEFGMCILEEREEYQEQEYEKYYLEGARALPRYRKSKYQR